MKYLMLNITDAIAKIITNMLFSDTYGLFVNSAKFSQLLVDRDNLIFMMFLSSKLNTCYICQLKQDETKSSYYR